MSIDHRPKLVRRVVTGVNAEGHSAVASDAETPTWVQRPTGSVIMDIWGVQSVPAQVIDESTGDLDRVLAPPVTGVNVRIAVFPPEVFSADAVTVAAIDTPIGDFQGEEGDASSRQIPGMHRTDTVDIVTVLDGEITVILEEGETILRAGDCLVQRGTMHAWRNRSDRPCTLASTMIAGVRA